MGVGCAVGAGVAAGAPLSALLKDWERFAALRSKEGGLGAVVAGELEATAEYSRSALIQLVSSSFEAARSRYTRPGVSNENS